MHPVIFHHRIFIMPFGKTKTCVLSRKVYIYWIMEPIANKEIEFLKSALCVDSEVMPNDRLQQWLNKRNDAVRVKVEQVPFRALTSWFFDHRSGNLRHETGRFFSIDGIRIHTNWGKVPTWEQPIINQPEIGFLGFIVKKINGIYHFLMQAKIEPGNINAVQFSPTFQATRSNYSQVHRGKRPLYFEYFNGAQPGRILVDQLQSEQGARFLKKRNRNIIIEVEEDLPVYDNFCWATLGQIKKLMKQDNVVNMDTRTVISGIPFGRYDSESPGLHRVLENSASAFSPRGRDLLNSMLVKDVYCCDFDDIISWLTRLKTMYELHLDKIPLLKVRNWNIAEDEIYHQARKYFSVIGVNVAIGNREVTSWCQPLVKPAQNGIVAFIAKKRCGVYHFLVQAKLEAGNFDIIELAPTVQCLTGNYEEGKNEYQVPFLDQVLNAEESRIWYSANQSEEGGRFFREQNRYMIIEAGPDFPADLPHNYCWMTLNQLALFLKFNNYLNISARSLISALQFT